MRKLLSILLVAVMLLAGAIAAEAIYEWSPWKEFGGVLGEDGKSWESLFLKSSIVFEGDTSDGNEATFTITEPTADRTFTFADESGTVLTTGGSGITALPLADTKIWIGGADGLADPQTVSGDSSITNAGVMTNDKIDNKAVDFGDVTTGRIQAANGTLWDAVAHSLTGDVTGTMVAAGTLATEIGANKVGTAEANLNAVSLLVASGTGINTVTVESGATLINWRLSAVAVVQNTPAIFNSDATTWVINTNEWLAADATFELLFLRP